MGQQNRMIGATVILILNFEFPAFIIAQDNLKKPLFLLKQYFASGSSKDC